MAMSSVSVVLNSLLRPSYGGEIYVPKMASTKIPDVVSAIYPEGLVKRIGNRPGDKMHETLVTVEELNHCVEESNGFVVYPELNKEDGWYCPYKKSVTISDSYRSDNNLVWKTVEDIKKDYEDCVKINAFNTNIYSGHLVI